MSGMILHETSRIVNGGETNYVLATTSLFVSLYNLFVSLAGAVRPGRQRRLSDGLIAADSQPEPVVTGSGFFFHG